ncbi:hypothetical protein SGPA1_50790 [Streptomyces misionensis JCM 4497]
MARDHQQRAPGHRVRPDHRVGDGGRAGPDLGDVPVGGAARRRVRATRLDVRAADAAAALRRRVHRDRRRVVRDVAGQGVERGGFRDPRLPAQRGGVDRQPSAGRQGVRRLTGYLTTVTLVP